jgi:potassium efflux system protein
MKTNRRSERFAPTGLDTISQGIQRRKRIGSIIGCCVALTVMFTPRGLASLAWAQEVEPAAAGVEPLSEDADTPAKSSPVEQLKLVQLKVDAVAALKLAEGQEETLRRLYQEAISEWEAAQTREADTQKAALQSATATESLAQQKQARDEESRLEAAAVPADLTLVELEQLLQERQRLLDVAVGEKEKQETEIEDRLSNRGAISAEIKAQRVRLEEIAEQLNIPAPNGELPQITEARRELLEARRVRCQLAIAALDAQEASYEANRLLPPVQSDLFTLRARRLEVEVKAIEAAVNLRRKDEAQNRLAEATRARRLYGQHPNEQVVAIVKQNVLSAEQGVELSRRLAQTAKAAQKNAKQIGGLEESLTRLKRRAGQGNAAFAILMGREKAKLPNAYSHRLQMKRHQSAAGELQTTIFEIQETRNNLSLIDEVANDLPIEDGDRETLRILATQQRDLLDENAALADRLFESLVNAVYAEQQLIDQAVGVRSFIDERILWLRSDAPLGLSDFQTVGQRIRWLADAPSWVGVGDYLLNAAVESPLLSSVLAILFIGILAARPRMRRALDTLAAEATRGSCITIAPTLKAAGLTIGLAGIIPLAMGVIGTLCLTAFGDPHSPFIRSIGAGALAASGILWLLDTLRTSCRPRGLGPSHFFWSSRVNETLRATLNWYMAPATILASLVATIEAQRNEVYHGSLGRFAFLLLMALTFAAARRIAHPERGIFTVYISTYPDSWFAKLRGLWYPAIAAGPVALMVLSASGYSYTAWQLSLRSYGSLLIMLQIQLVGSILFRWIVVNRRQLTVTRFRERIKREQAHGESGPLHEPDSDPVTINVQTQRLIRAGLICATVTMLAGVWADVSPALRSLDRINLWHVSGNITGELVGVSVADALVAIIVFAMTMIAARNLPGLLEVAVLQHLPIDSSVRYAITTMGRYIIIIVGVIAAASMFGIAWENIQWLVAAMGVGLGFGLQEVVANFVCGVILMFERPIRVGDIITLGDVTGTVSRIRIRATTLTDWDGKELVVPNKDLITGRLLNWTLTDSRNRVVINIGIAYGSDVELASTIMLKVAEANSEVLADPAPSVTFDAFGDSALNLVLRAFLGTLDNRLSTIHALHEQLHCRLNEAKIEIAFPQQDVNIRSVPTGV